MLPRCVGCGGNLDAVGRGGLCLHCKCPITATFRLAGWFGPQCRLRRLRAGAFLWILSAGVWFASATIWSWYHVFHLQMGWRNLQLPPRWFFPTGPYALGLRSWYPPPNNDPVILLIGAYLAVSWLMFFIACWCLGIAPPRHGARAVAITVRWTGPLLVIAGVVTAFALKDWHFIASESRSRIADRVIDGLLTLPLALHFFLLALRTGDRWLRPLADLSFFVAAVGLSMLLSLSFFDWWHSPLLEMTPTVLPHVLPSLLAVLYLPFILRLDAVLVSARQTPVLDTTRGPSPDNAAPAPPPG